MGEEFMGSYDDYMNAILAAPNGTMIKLGELTPAGWMKCTVCGAEMSSCFTAAHEVDCHD